MAMSQTTQSMIKVELDMALERPDQLELAPLALPALPRSSRRLRSNSVFLPACRANTERENSRADSVRQQPWRLSTMHGIASLNKYLVSGQFLTRPSEQV